MADLLVRHLRNKGSEHSALELLVNQWGFDQQLIPKALQNIGALFPHFSRHDESHSKQILINIERLLGEGLSLLTATDTWLLLEAAYWHDIGMVVPESDVAEALNSSDFLLYVDSIRNSPNHELHRFCLSFTGKDVSTCFAGADTPANAVSQFRELMAEWFRRQHPDRANRIVQAPWGNAGISSPRTELIPARLFKVLGRICQMHGEPFEKILGEGGLPFREAGMAQEDCHPRFVACLLRMGDLLDLDDNRFCPVMQRIAGSERPNLSKAHEDKHAGIRHLRIDREYIEVAAECDTIDGYLEAFKWFDWLKFEMQAQMSNWQNIVPNRALGLLPTLGPISVRLNGKFQVLTVGQRPQFQIDSGKIKELLQGSNLYSSEYACVRELLQNAVDATLIRAWQTRDAKRGLDGWSMPFSTRAIEELEKYPIRVNIEEEGRVHGSSIWVVTIVDEGTGISREDLIHLINIGGSYRNSKKQAVVNAMPEWMKPSGTFGIGFQSIFLISDEVVVTSKNIYTNETLQIEMHSPTKDKEGLILLQVLESDLSRPFGTELKFKLKLEAFARRYSISMGDQHSIASQVIRSLDPVLDEAFPYHAAKILDKVQGFAIHSMVPVKAGLKTIGGAQDYELETPLPREDAQTHHWNFLQIGDHLVRLRYRPAYRLGSYCSVDAFYRGQKFECKETQYPYIDVGIDLISGKAGSWLNANRDSLAAKAIKDFSELVDEALQKQIEIDLASRGGVCATYEDLVQLSFFLQIMRLKCGGAWKSLAQKAVSQWLDLIPSSFSTSYRKLFEKDSFSVAVRGYGNANPSYCDAVVEGDMLDVFAWEWINVRRGTIQVVHASEITAEACEKEQLCYRFSIEPQAPFTRKALAAKLYKICKGTTFNRRYTLYCFDEKWLPLALKSGTKVRTLNLLGYIEPTVPQILLPFLFSEGHRFGRRSVDSESSIEKLCQWVRPRLAVDMTESKLRALYEELIQFFDIELMTNEFSDNWIEARAVKSTES